MCSDVFESQQVFGISMKKNLDFGVKLMSVPNLHCKLFLERMLFIIIHHKFSLTSTSLVLSAFKLYNGT